MRERICCAYPADAGMQPLEERPDLAGMGRYRGLIAGLLAVQLQEDGRPRLMRLDKEARQAWTEQERVLCAAVNDAGFNPSQQGAYAKGRGIAGRSACLLRVLRHVAQIEAALKEDQALAPETVQQIADTFPEEVGPALVVDA